MTNILIVLTSILGSQFTFSLIHKAKLSVVRAATLASLIFILATFAIPSPIIIHLQAAFFGATFVGMADKSRLGWKKVFVASLLYSLIFILISPLSLGVGGSLGAAAFVSCAVVFTISKILKV